MKPHSDLPKAFAELGVEVRFLQALAKMGFEKPSEIQRALIPLALEGVDLMGQARTGTGKTAAFGLPVMQQLDPAERIQALCLVPTRELAVQVAGELRRMAEQTKLHIVPIYGGQSMAAQQRKLGRKPHFIVGTPGRVMDFMRRGLLPTDGVKHVVLDEVDRMLDIGFRDDIKWILGHITHAHQTIFVSATLEDEIKRLGARYLTNPREVNVSRDELTVDSVDQFYITVDPWDKFRLLRLILEQERHPTSIVFCNTRHAARKLAGKLYDAGISAKEIHGDLIQRKRDRVMEWFRKHQIKVLVATDLASRGIDVAAITHIINYDLPEDVEAYVHRIGRTARMGARGIAISFATREQGKLLTMIEMLINKEIPERVVRDFKPSPPPRERDAPPKPEPAEQPLSRFQAPVHTETSTTAEAGAAKRPQKTLGSRFKPLRGRRRL